MAHARGDNDDGWKIDFAFLVWHNGGIHRWSVDGDRSLQRLFRERSMKDDLILPPFPEVCVIHKLDKKLGISPEEMPFLMQSLLVRGWIWRMPAKYQHIAVQMLQSGVIRDVKKTETKKENDMVERVRIQIMVKNGEAIAIKTSGDVVDIEVVDTDNGTTVHYSSYEGDGAPIWVGGKDDECPFDPDSVPENN